MKSFAPPVARGLPVVVAIMLMLSSASTPAEAAISGEVRFVINQNTGAPMLMSAANGSGLHAITCAGDLTYGGAPRMFLHAQTTGATAYYGPQIELFAYDEDCTAGLQLTTDPSIKHRASYWSPNGSRVVYGGSRYAPDGAVLQQGLFVADVLRSADGRPTGIVNDRLAVAQPSDTGGASWGPDNRRVTYDFAFPTPDGWHQQDVLVADLDTCPAGEGSCVVTNITATPATSEWQPAFSPIGNKIAFTTQTSNGGYVRLDIFVLDLTSGARKQVTTKSNANHIYEIGRPCWSPDGQYIGFDGRPGGFDLDIYRIKADGTQKAVNLTTAITDRLVSIYWRR